MTHTRRRWGRYVALGILVLVGLFLWTRPVCWRAYLFQGVDARTCPDGAFRQTISANLYSIKRGGEASLSITARAHYVTEDSAYDQVGVVKKVRATVALVHPDGHEEPLPVVGTWRDGRGSQSGQVKFPAVPDGDYKVRVRAESSVGQDTVDVPVALYAPARVHVITDRPLYQAGDLIKFRAVVLRARDLVPLDGRPGRWEIRDPSGELMLEERAPAGNWGVVAGTIPLDRGAATGDWRIAWVSGDARDEVAVKVQPFVLPRFRIEASAQKPFYQAHQKPEVKGRVVYSSGAPVAGAKLNFTWSVGGSWPPPNGWLTHDLPQHAVTDKDGAFDLKLPEVPADLQGQAPLSVRIAATDASGDRVEGGASALLSEDAIGVSTVTELADGLVEGFNNRLFLRASTADGQVLPGVELTVQRAWDPDEPGDKTTTDEDGVAQLQLDPGPAVNVVIPPPPYRPPQPTPAVALTQSSDLLESDADAVKLSDQLALERLVPQLAPCARFVRGDGDADGTQVTVGLEVDASGAIRARGSAEDPLSGCTTELLRAQHLPAGKPRLLDLALQFSDGALPQVAVDVQGLPTAPEDLQQLLVTRVLDARSCMPRRMGQAGTLVERATWHLAAGQRSVALSWLAEPGEARSLQSCLQSRAASVALDDPSSQDEVGVVTVSVTPSEEEQSTRPEATTMLGYELKVTARKDGKELGHTTLRLKPGSVPRLRLRATPVLAQAGGPLDVELLRGPNYDGELPRKAYLYSDALTKPLEAEIDEEKHTAHFTLPAGAAGWYSVRADMAQALVYVRSQQELTVALQTEQPRYAPGQTAKLGILTRIGGKGAQAAVGLFGVDESLGQLATLPGPDDMARVRSKVEMSSPAFGSLDAEALTLGRIRGKNAAMATILRVQGMPTAAELDGVFQGNGQTTFDPNEVLTDHFYDVLGELHALARAWEDQAPQGKKMRLPEMVKLWNQALAAVKARGGDVTDAYGRPLRLSRLPPDLLALTDPRQVIIQGTRLPEDVENWAAYVAKEKP